MWERDPACHWCGIVTVLPNAANRMPRNMATIDHLWPRYHPNRLAGDHAVVLACYGCNERRNRDDYKTRTAEENRAIADQMRDLRAERRARHERHEREKLRVKPGRFFAPMVERWVS